jgi:hypothetical protein
MPIKMILWNAAFVLIFIALMIGVGVLAIEYKGDASAFTSDTGGSGHG